MRIFKSTLFLSALSLLLTSCSDQFDKTKSGLIYKIIPAKNKGQKVNPGSVIKFHVLVTQGDSVTYNSYGKIPAFAMIDSSVRNYDISEVSVHKAYCFQYTCDLMIPLYCGSYKFLW
jgi:hypothetical protein